MKTKKINDNINNKSELFVCDCSSTEHQFIITLDDDKKLGKLMFIEIHLAKLPFRKRIIAGIKYIFGHKCNYGNFEEVIINKNDKERLLNVINQL
jgi:hypothetical protein